MSKIHTVNVKENGTTFSTTLEGEQARVQYNSQLVLISISDMCGVFYRECFTNMSLQEINKELELMDIVLKMI